MKNFFIVFCLFMMPGFTAKAATFTYAYVADNPIVINVNDSESSMADFVAGLPQVTGTITFDDTLISDMPTPSTVSTKVYAPAVITVDGIDTSGILPGDFVYLRDEIFGTSDSLEAVSRITSPTPTDAIDLLMFDNSGALLPANFFPGDIDLADFGPFRRLVFWNPRFDNAIGDPGDRVDFTVTSLTLVSTSVPEVPLPAGLPLLAGGLLALGLLRSRRG